MTLCLGVGIFLFLPFHEVIALHPPSFHRNDFSTCAIPMRETTIDNRKRKCSTSRIRRAPESTAGFCTCSSYGVPSSSVYLHTIGVLRIFRNDLQGCCVRNGLPFPPVDCRLRRSGNRYEYCTVLDTKSLELAFLDILVFVSSTVAKTLFVC